MDPINTTDLGLGLSYCGIRATQRAVDYFLWEKVLNDHEVDGIIELGTAYGGFSLYLYHQATARNIKFITFDNVDHANDRVDTLFGRPGIYQRTAYHLIDSSFLKVDILRNPLPVIAAINSLNRPILFCDNGSKKQEVAIFTEHLPKDSILIVHDWLIEIGYEDIPENCAERYGDLCDEIDSWSRVFIKS